MFSLLLKDLNFSLLIVVVNIKNKYTNLITKIWRNLLEYWQELVILCQCFASVTLTLTFLKRVILDILSYCLNNGVL